MQHLWLIPALPFAGFLINGIFGRRLPKALINAVAIGSVLLSFLWVLKVLAGLWPIEAPHLERYFDWIRSGDLRIGADLMVDRLTAVMLLVVTGVGLLIHIYSVGYMAHEGGYYRFFSFLNLFTFFMLTLVLGANLLIMFVGWEGVGLCSYLLIGFYFLRKSATNAGNKAFIVNRIGDFGFSLAVFLSFLTFGSLDFGEMFRAVSGMTTEQTTGTLTIICLLLLLGAAGKSAQIPLYVWLPDAMEGPTPVSALIHAATLVTHAFFKALLFLGAGSVIHALGGEQDMRRMGGLLRKIPWTGGVMLAAAAAISALPFTSGFYSKDEILLGVHHHSPLMFWIAVFTAGLTAFYVFRSIFLVFFGEYRGSAAHPHESPWVMLGPLVVLAILSLAGGKLFPVSEFLEPLFGKSELAHDPALVIIGTSAGILGVLIAWFAYIARPGTAAERFVGRFWPLTFLFDRIYNAFVVEPVVGGSRSVLWRGIDAGVIDGAVNGLAARARGVGGVLRLVQSGNIRSYAAWVLLGGIGVLLALGVTR